MLYSKLGTALKKRAIWHKDIGSDPLMLYTFTHMPLLHDFQMTHTAYAAWPCCDITLQTCASHTNDRAHCTVSTQHDPAVIPYCTPDTNCTSECGDSLARVSSSSREGQHVQCEVTANLGSEAGGSGGMGEHTPLGAVCGHVPGGACRGIKVIMPVLVKGVVGVIHSVNQPIVEHLRRSCNTEDKP